MTKSNQNNLAIMFWALLGLFSILLGIDVINDAVNRTVYSDRGSVSFGIGALIFGSMVLGVAVNKFSISLKSKNGKGKSK